MRRRSTARLVLALVASSAAYQLAFPPAMAMGGAVFGAFGLVVAVVLLGFGLALLFSGISDGPVALIRVLKSDGHRAIDGNTGGTRSHHAHR